MELMSEVTNLIDLGQYPRNDVELIAREYMRCAYLDTLDTYAKEYMELDEENADRIAVLATLDAFEHTIAVLDGNEDFLQLIHSPSEEEKANMETAEDAEFERF
tara:strand:- start:117 stop:428 length:312 start_codon:yes stop_codon:yes gene_type:complete